MSAASNQVLPCRMSVLRYRTALTDVALRCCGVHKEREFGPPRAASGVRFAEQAVHGLGHVPGEIKVLVPMRDIGGGFGHFPDLCDCRMEDTHQFHARGIRSVPGRFFAAASGTLVIEGASPRAAMMFMVVRTESKSAIVSFVLLPPIGRVPPQQAGARIGRSRLVYPRHLLGRQHRDPVTPRHRSGALPGSWICSMARAGRIRSPPPVFPTAAGCSLINSPRSTRSRALSRIALTASSCG